MASCLACVGQKRFYLLQYNPTCVQTLLKWNQKTWPREIHLQKVWHSSRALDDILVLFCKYSNGQNDLILHCAILRNQLWWNSITTTRVVCVQFTRIHKHTNKCKCTRNPQGQRRLARLIFPNRFFNGNQFYSNLLTQCPSASRRCSLCVLVPLWHLHSDFGTFSRHEATLACWTRFARRHLATSEDAPPV